VLVRKGEPLARQMLAAIDEGDIGAVAFAGRRNGT
jgi:hypothetical protein